MTALRNSEFELQQFRLRISVAAVFVVVCFALLFLRFAWLQVVKHDNYLAQAEENRISMVPVVPNRGLIIDRNGIVLARNYSAYTLELVPYRVKDIEETLTALSQYIEIGPRDRRRFKKLLDESKKLDSIVVRSRLSDDEVARFTANRWRFPGVDIQARLFRQYPLGETASHLIGYIGRISPKDAENIADGDDASNYQGTEYIGKDGVEKKYENVLHGATGMEEVEVSAGGKAIRLLKQSKSSPGSNVILSIDINLQRLIEQWYGNRRGALVALDPKTGEVLAFVSKPTFDPNLFVEGIDIENWKALNESLDRPLLNRPLAGTYPPGSTYKPFMALAALSLGKRTPEQSISDPGHFWFGNHQFRDDKVGGHGVVDMYKSIVQSCDTYYYILANDLGIDAIHDFMKPFGFGQKTGIDLEGEKTGILPSTMWKRNYFKKVAQQKWFAGETISVGIGQGYNSFTMVQLANAVSTLLNQGQGTQPRVVRAVEDPKTNTRTVTQVVNTEKIPLNPEHVAVIKNAFVGVNKEGTSAQAFANTAYVAGGKTGTAQVISIKQGEKYDASKIDERKRDHALFVAYAPADDPKIVIALIVENAGFGAQAAAPIARKAFDYYLTGKVPAEDASLILKSNKP